MEEVLMLAIDLAQLRAKISSLDLSITLLKSKNCRIEEQGARMSQDIATLQSEIASLQSKVSVAAGGQTDKANDWAIELEIQTAKLEKDMEARASDAEKKVQELNATLQRNEGQKALLL